MPDRSRLEAAELAELEAIRGKHQAEIARRGGVVPARAVSLAEMEEHAGHAAGLSAAGVVFGPDTSEYQGSPAWGTVKASGCALGFYKVSEGRTYEDPSHQWSRSRVPNAGLIPLGYHFLYYSDEYASRPALWGAQAAFFCSLVDPHAGHCLDVEAAATAGHHLGVREWVAEYRKLFPGHPLGGYFNRALWENRSRMPYDPRDLFDYVWHAGVGNGFYTSATGTIAQQWAGTGTLTNSAAGIGYPTVKLWQITDHAKVPGVSGSFCDGNAFQGTAAELTALIAGGDDSMSQAEVDDLKTFIRQTLAGYADDYAAAVLRAKLGKSDTTVGVALQETFRASDDAVGLTGDAVKAVAQAVAALEGAGPGGTLTPADVEAAVRRVVAGSRIVADPPTA